MYQVAIPRPQRLLLLGFSLSTIHFLFSLLLGHFLLVLLRLLLGLQPRFRPRRAGCLLGLPQNLPLGSPPLPSLPVLLEPPLRFFPRPLLGSRFLGLPPLRLPGQPHRLEVLGIRLDLDDGPVCQAGSQRGVLRRELGAVVHEADLALLQAEPAACQAHHDLQPCRAQQGDVDLLALRGLHGQVKPALARVGRESCSARVLPRVIWKPAADLNDITLLEAELLRRGVGIDLPPAKRDVGDAGAEAQSAAEVLRQDSQRNCVSEDEVYFCAGLVPGRQVQRLPHELLERLLLLHLPPRLLLGPQPRLPPPLGPRRLLGRARRLRGLVLLLPGTLPPAPLRSLPQLLIPGAPPGQLPQLPPRLLQLLRPGLPPLHRLVAGGGLGHVHDPLQLSGLCVPPLCRHWLLNCGVGPHLAGQRGLPPRAPPSGDPLAPGQVLAAGLLQEWPVRESRGVVSQGDALNEQQGIIQDACFRATAALHVRLLQGERQRAAKPKQPGQRERCHGPEAMLPRRWQHAF
mmetsp:Transcript_105403/g.308135  ORF Transcript_105403/g.308135 Transcript_105403/m.308135 type:complete len:515 (+) Transcript_105403:497-2041(+)